GPDPAEASRLFGNACLAAMELDEQHRRLGKRELRIGVAGFYLQRVEELDARDRNAGLDGEDRSVAAGFDRGEWADTRRDRLRDAGELQRQLGDGAKRALGADEQPGEVVAGRGFLGAAGGRYLLAAGEHDFEREPVV